MYYEEKIIDGVLCFRGSPKESFTPMSAEMLTQRLLRVKEELENVKAVL